MIKVRCAKCGKTLNIPDQFAGKKGKCPGCQEMLTIPAASAEVSAVAPAPPTARKPAPPAPVEEVEEVEEAQEVEEEEPAEEVESEEEERIADRPANRRSRPAENEEEERVARQPARKRPRPVEDDEDAPPQRKRRKSGGEWAECPSCGACDATRVRWTWWGGLVGPMIINTVRCNDCGTKYNGVHGDSNTTRIVIYTVVAGLISLVIIGVAAAVALANA